MSRSMTVRAAGAMGGNTRAKNLTPEQRVKAARKAAKVRWENHAKRQVASSVPTYPEIVTTAENKV